MAKSTRTYYIYIHSFHLHIFFLTINNGKLGIGFLLISMVVGTPTANHGITPTPTLTPIANPVATPTLTLTANPDASPTLATPTSTMHLVATATATATPTPTQTPARHPATPTPRPTNDSAIPSFIASGLLGIIVGSFVLVCTVCSCFGCWIYHRIKERERVHAV